ncbi:low-density lipoprotein receptor-related protein 3 [Ursus maritimus]|uniref:Low-density lipoprotein receptor-related protein 3 n=1 Tax=Ursus maritimus TaxID=29073 RepID=A0A8M1G3V2_URSMA|nr:low-density lipoprotein receptor-related protein 3 [Ursus maritimus]
MEKRAAAGPEGAPGARAQLAVVCLVNIVLTGRLSSAVPALAACSGKLEQHTERRGVIYSPAWPLNYPPGTNCSWYIQGDRGDMITISGRDEQGCPACPPDQYPCEGGSGLCYAPADRCNNQKSCPDGADEKNCFSCQPGTFHCGTNLCIFETWRCDGQEDCQDGSDEHGCLAAVPRKVITAALIGSLVCGLLLVIALGCAFKLYSLRTQEYRWVGGRLAGIPGGRGGGPVGCGPGQPRHAALLPAAFRAFETQMTRLEAEFVRREAPPSYGQLIAQGLIPPVEDFPVYSASQSDLHCTWLVDTQDPRRVLLQLELRLGYDDYVQVYEGLGERGDRLLQTLSYRSNHRPVSLEAAQGRLTVAYHARARSAGHGFNATYQVKGYCLPWEQPCGSGGEGAAGDAGEQGCFSEPQRCDGWWHCASGRDEQGCPACPPDQYPCEGGSGLCYAPADRCNNQKSCPDGADEKNCFSCQPGTFHCGTNLCIFETWRCDGQEDCQDGSDEHGCLAAVPRKVITAALIGSLVCGLLLVIALGCAFKLYSLRTQEYRAFETQMTRLEAEFVRREAPPSYGQLIAQGLIPPVEDFPVYSASQASVLQNLRTAMRRQMRRHASRRGPSRRRLGRLWNRLFHRPRAPRGQIPLLTAARTSQTVLGDGLLQPASGSTPDPPAPLTDTGSPVAAGDGPPSAPGHAPEVGSAVPPPSGLRDPECRLVDKDRKAGRDPLVDSPASVDMPREPCSAQDPHPPAPTASSTLGPHPPEPLGVCRSPPPPCSPMLEASDDEALLVC